MITLESAMSTREVALECTPMAIARRLGLQPYDWQDAVMRDAMPKFSQVALRAANESGKTSIICVALVLWHLLIFSNGTVVITSGTWRQVEKQVFNALKVREAQFPGCVFNVKEILAPDGNRAIGVSTDEGKKFEGFHSHDHDRSPLMIIVDEAKSVSDEIHGAITRCRPTRIVEMSSPGAASGAFYRIFTSERAGWKHHVVTAFQCPHIPRALIDRDIARYGDDSPLIRSMIYAEWMLQGDTEQFVFPWIKLEKTLRNPPMEQNLEDVSAFCDFAVSADGDENTLTIRRGNKVELADAWRGSGDTVREAHRFVTLFQKHGLKAEQIDGDVSGIGHGYCDVLATMGYSIGRVNNGEASTQPKRYANLGTEMWFEAARVIERGEIILPSDDKTHKQLAARKFKVDIKGRLQLLSKSEGGESPDRADGVVGVLRRYGRQLEPINMFRSSPMDSFRDEVLGIESDNLQGNSWMSSSI